MAVDVLEADLTEPAQLRLHVEQPIGGILAIERLVDRGEELAGAVAALGDATCSKFANTPPGSSSANASA